MYETRLLGEDIKELRAEMEARTRRRNIKNRYIKNAGLLSAVEVDSSLWEEYEEGDEDTIIVATTAQQQRCGKCSKPGHNSRTCSN